MANNNISTKDARSKLTPRKEPYWRKMAEGEYVGYRCISSTKGSWIARWRTPEGKQKYKALDNTEYEGVKLKHLHHKDQFKVAQKLANDYFQESRAGIHKRYTVDDAADLYLEYLGLEKGKRSARDAKGKIDTHIRPFLGDKYLSELSASHISHWKTKLAKIESEDKDEIRKRKATVNRVFSTLKALLNYAWRNDYVANDSAWRKVQAFKNVESARNAFTDAQIQRLIDKTTGAFHNVVKALDLVGMRPGAEIEELLTEDFDPKSGTLSMGKHKTKARIIHLTDEAVTFFKQLAKDKHPKAPLLPRDDGEKWRRGELTEVMEGYAKKAKLPEWSVLYCIRHAFITRKILELEPITEIARNCGTSIDMIERHYAKPLAEAEKMRIKAKIRSLGSRQ